MKLKNCIQCKYAKYSKLDNTVTTKQLGYGVFFFNIFCWLRIFVYF